MVHLAWALTTALALGVQMLFQVALEIPRLSWIIPVRELLGHQLRPGSWRRREQRAHRSRLGISGSRPSL
jgi:hypothetical protein